uniref:Putative secreted protein n=1 Tax=Ixodes ricinus TaxID=34613 RepID=A0A6B0TWU1_IXORI
MAFPTVCSVMVAQFRIESKCLGIKLTLVWFFICVGPIMADQIASEKRLGGILALKWLFTGVLDYAFLIYDSEQRLWGNACT